MLRPDAGAWLAGGGHHPANVYLREDHLTRKVNAWIATLFSPQNLDSTAEALAAVDDEQEAREPASIGLTRRIALAESAMVRLRQALEAGWDPAALTEQYNAAAAEKRAAEAELSTVEVPEQVSGADIREMVHEVGDMASALDQADAKDMASLY